MTIRHVVMWKLASHDAAERAEHAAEVARRLRSLVGTVEQIQSLQVGTEALYPDANFDVVLIADFASAADLEGYQVHPAHQEVAGFVRSVVASRAAVDFEI